MLIENTQFTIECDEPDCNRSAGPETSFETVWNVATVAGWDLSQDESGVHAKCVLHRTRNVCWECGATIFLIPSGLHFKWVTNPRDTATWHCGTDPAKPTSAHAPKGVVPAAEAEAARGVIDLALASRERFVRQQIWASDVLSEPVEEGYWRWADTNTSGYGKKSEEELAADRDRARAKAIQFRAELDAIRYAREWLTREGIL